MIVDAKSLPQQFTIEADICIVGAGAAGITMARDLAGGRMRVALLEGGDMSLTPDSQHLYAGDVIGHAHTPLEFDRLRFFGGSTNHWSGSCRPFQAGDFEGWPFGLEIMEPFYRRAQVICQLGPYTYKAEDWQSEQAIALKFQDGSRLQNGVFQYSPPTRFGTVYQDDLASASNVTVYINANVVDIETRHGGNEVTGLAVACFGGKRMRAQAQQYVLAAGGIENPRLLLNSNKDRTAGLGNEFDLVGRYFMDHPFVQGAATVLAHSPRPEFQFYDQRNIGGHGVEGYMAPTDEARRQEQLLPCAISLRRVEPIDSDFGGFAVPEGLRKRLGENAANSLTYAVSQLMIDADTSWDWIYSKLWRRPPGIFTTVYICGPDPDPESRVTLSGSVDAFGMLRTVLDWRLPSDFESKMRRAHEILGEELGRIGIARLRMESSATGKDPMQDLSNGHHHMGTTRIHQNPRQGVVDEHCRVHALTNLYIAGSSVFPTYACDDPTMTIVALALRLSDHLKSLAS
jgi:choline dehydrogenase-like flavoprotein